MRQYRNKEWISLDSSGSTFIEAALILPFFLTLVFSLIQYGIIYTGSVTIDNATSVAVRYSTLYGVVACSTSTDCSTAESYTSGDCCDVLQDIVGDAIQPLLTPNSVTDVSVNGNATVGGQAGAMEVEVTYDLGLIFPFVVPNANADGTISLTAKTVMR